MARPLTQEKSRQQPMQRKQQSQVQKTEQQILMLDHAQLAEFSMPGSPDIKRPQTTSKSGFYFFKPPMLPTPQSQTV
mgnify:CR=1 FL=1